MTNIIIVGGGTGGTSILKAFKGLNNFKIIGVCDVNPNAPGIILARSLKIPVFNDLEVALQQPQLDVVIEATGNPKVKYTIYKKKQTSTTVIDSEVANILMTLTESQNEILDKLNNKKEAFITAAPFLTKTYEGGVIYFTTNLEHYDFVINKDLEIPGVKNGEIIVADGFVRQCIRTQKEVIGTIDAKVYGTRLKIWVMPIFSNDSKEVIGTFGVFLPKIHPIAKAFNDFAPVLAQSFPEGALIIGTDLENITHRQGSDKFDIKFLKVGTKMGKNDAAPQSIRARSRVVMNVNAKAFGIPAQLISVPLFDDESDEVIGAFGLIFPRAMAHDLQEMAIKLNTSTQEMASVMQEIAASSNEINLNEGNLADNVREVQIISERINEILEFIKNVADQTKILGINAAIEAARAAEHGRGFGVVAQEIRKLSDQSKETAEQIGKLTKEIAGKIAIIMNASQENVKQSQEQAAATEEVTASVTELADLAEKLSHLANSL